MKTCEIFEPCHCIEFISISCKHYLPMTTPTNHNNKTKVKCYNLFPSFQHDQYITNTFISQSYGSFTKQLYLYSASVLPCFCFSATQRIFQISIASVLYRLRIIIRTEIQSGSAPKIRIFRMPDPNPDNKMLNSSKPKPDPDILLF